MNSMSMHRHAFFFSLFFVPSFLLSQSLLPMTFMDVLTMRNAGGWSISLDAKWMTYVLTTPDWKTGKIYSDIYLVSMKEGYRSARQMTFTKDKNESAPQWSRDNYGFAFLSNREAPESKTTQNQLYYMRIDGGEAARLTEAKEGVASFAFSKDGTHLAFTAGKDDERQIWIIPTMNLADQKPVQLTKHKAGVGSWVFSPDGSRIYFTAADSTDKPNRDRKEKKFDVRIRNEETPIVRLWTVAIDTKTIERLTSSDDYSVEGVTLSDDGKWLGFRGIPNDRYVRGTTDANEYGDLFLLETQTGTIERLTQNADIGESGISFSPDNARLVFSASARFEYFRNDRIYVRELKRRGESCRMLESDFDGDLSPAFWSADGKTIYANAGVRAANQLLSLDAATGRTSQLTFDSASTIVSYHKDSRQLIASFSSPTTPTDLFHIPKPSNIAKRSTWTQLTDANPQVDSLQLGATRAIQWLSSDGKMVEGVLVLPVGYESGKRYPLIVQIHGGPAGASTLAFTAGYGNYSHIYAGAGYVCLQPNYRGSTNYGEKFKMEISGDYFRQGYDDIMTGVDHLIRAGIVDSTAMGCMGWSAGGHWSNWILTHTDRFKAISSAAGTMNWTSMYAQTDVQRGREFYFGGKPYDRFDHYWDVSPLKYNKNAKTPTLIQVVDGDPRVPRPQSDELHMALKKLGVPTEYLVYPGATHGLTDLRHQMIKMTAEFNWFEKYLRGRTEWIDWKKLVESVGDKSPEEKEKQ